MSHAPLPPAYPQSKTASDANIGKGVDTMERVGLGVVTHELKIWPVWFGVVVSGVKRAEVRRMDRDYRVGDTLWLRECSAGEYTGRDAHTTITHITRSIPGLDPEYGVLSIRIDAYGMGA